MLGLRKKDGPSGKGKDPIYVDMENFDIKGDRSVVKIRVFIIKDMDNLADIKAYLGSGDILIPDLSEIPGTGRTSMINEINRMTNEAGYDFHRSNDHLLILAPKGTSVKKMVQE